MADAFNPYREWLGLLDCPHPNYYQLLGLTTGEPDPGKIAVAGDRAATKVHAVNPGGHTAARSKLLAEIQFAKTCLLDPSHKAEYDKKLKASRPKSLPKATPLTPVGPKAQSKPSPTPRSGGHAHDLPPGSPAAMPPGYPQPMPGYPPAGQTPAWGAPQPAGYGQPYAPPNPAPAAVPGGYPSWPQPGYPAAAGPGPYAGPMSPGPQPGAMTPYNPYGAAPAMGPAPGYAALYNNAPDPGGSGIQLNQPRGLSRAAQALASRRQQETKNILLLGAGSLVVIVGVSLLAYVALTAKKSDKPMPVAESDRQSPVDSQTAEPLPPESKPVAAAPQSVTKPVATPTPSPTPAAAPTKVPQPEPPKPAPPEPVVPPTKQELLELGSTLTSAKAALGKQDFDRAATAIARAELLAKLPEHQAMTARLKEVAGYTKQFREAFVAAVQGFQVGDEIKVGSSTMVIVVETDKDKIVFRTAGQNRTYRLDRLDDLPLGLTLGIADVRLDESDPVNDVVRGAYRSVLDKVTFPDTLAKAQSFWEAAQARGINTNHLMPFLTDDYNLAKAE